MKKFLKPLIAGGLALSALGAGAAWADHPDSRRDGGVSLTISVGDHDYDRRGRYDRYDRYDSYDRRGPRNGYHGRIVNREVYDTRYRARIVLTEEIVRTRHGPRLICTVDARGPQARYVPHKRLRKIARNECSRRAEVRILA
jgi:hypothetical protein